MNRYKTSGSKDEPNIVFNRKPNSMSSQWQSSRWPCWSIPSLISIYFFYCWSCSRNQYTSGWNTACWTL